MRHVSLWTICLLAALGTATAQSPPDAETTVEQLSWLAGCWSAAEAQGETLECWTAPAENLMLGLNRTLRHGRGASFEFLRIAVNGDHVVYFASPGGGPATAFRLVNVSASEVTFENPEHDFPQRIRYTLVHPEELRVRIEATVDGTARQMEWTWYATEFPAADEP